MMQQAFSSSTIPNISTYKYIYTHYISRTRRGYNIFLFFLFIFSFLFLSGKTQFGFVMLFDQKAFLRERGIIIFRVGVFLFLILRCEVRRKGGGEMFFFSCQIKINTQNKAQNVHYYIHDKINENHLLLFFSVYIV